MVYNNLNYYFPKEFIYSQKEIEEKGYIIKNDYLESIRIKVEGHFGNCPSLILFFSQCVLGGYNNTIKLGKIIHTLYYVLDQIDDDGLYLDELKNVPVRLIFEGDGNIGSKCVGFGNFMLDRFVFFKDLCSRIKE